MINRLWTQSESSRAPALTFHREHRPAARFHPPTPAVPARAPAQHRSDPPCKHTLQSQRGRDHCRGRSSPSCCCMLFTAMFVVSLRYARAMSQKAETLREHELTPSLRRAVHRRKNRPPAWLGPGNRAGASTFSAGAGAGAFTVDGVELDQRGRPKRRSEREQRPRPPPRQHTFHRYSQEHGRRDGPRHEAAFAKPARHHAGGAESVRTALLSHPDAGGGHADTAPAPRPTGTSSSRPAPRIWPTPSSRRSAARCSTPTAISASPTARRTLIIWTAFFDVQGPADNSEGTALEFSVYPQPH